MAAAATNLDRDLSGEIGVPEPEYKTHPITDDYEILWDRKLGTGINGAVVVCRLRASGELFALKFLRNRKESRREIALHFKCAAHPNVVKVFAAYSNVIGRGPRDGKAPQRSLLLVMEMMRGGELFDRVIEKQSLTEAEASAAMRQVVEALRYCHSLDVAHRDLKPENLLYASKADDALLKLSDFGFAKIDRGDLVTPVYTPYYVPPQILAAQTAHRARKDREAAAAAAAAQGGARAVVLAAGTGAGVAGGVAGGSQVVAYDKSCDMWSIGVILYILLCGYPPFQSEVPGQDLSESMQRQIHAGTFHFHEQYWRGISDDAKEVVRGLICPQAEQRLNVTQLRRHRWVAGQDVPMTPLQTPGHLAAAGGGRRRAQEQMDAELTLMRKREPVRLKPVAASKNKLQQKRDARAAAKTAAATAEAAIAASGTATAPMEAEFAKLSTV